MTQSLTMCVKGKHVAALDTSVLDMFVNKIVQDVNYNFHFAIMDTRLCNKAADIFPISGSRIARSIPYLQLESAEEKNVFV